MTSATRTLLAVVTLMSVVNHSYLTIVLPHKDHMTFDLYIKNNSKNDDLLSEVEYKTTKDNYDKIMAEIEKNAIYKQFLSALPDIREKEVDVLTRIDKMRGCGEGLRSTIENHIKKRYKDFMLNNKHVTENPSKHMSDLTKITPGKEDEKYIEELEFLSTLIPLSSSSGRLRSIYLNTVYVDVQHKTVDSDAFFRTVWLILLRLSDPMLGEAYTSYAIRMIKKDLMPLPKDLVPVYYKNINLQLHDDFDIWPELNAVYVLYYLFQCPVQETLHEDSSEVGKSVTSTQTSDSVQETLHKDSSEDSKSVPPGTHPKE